MTKQKGMSTLAPPDAPAIVGKQLPLLKITPRPVISRAEYAQLLRRVHLKTASADDRRAARAFERAVFGR